MKKKHFCAGIPCVIPLLAATFFLNNLFCPASSYGQIMRPIKSEIATCEIKVSSKQAVTSVLNAKGAFKKKAKITDVVKSYKPGIDQLGRFHRIPNILPRQSVPVEITYPASNIGDKVLMIAADGGTFENDEKEKVVHINWEKKLSFTFRTSNDPGIYRVVLRKGNDTKVVQLWVGKEPLPVTK